MSFETWKMETYGQSEYDVRCEWGREGIDRLREHTAVFIIVDVFSFTTAVEIAVSRGAWIYPYPWRDESVADFAARVGAKVAGRRGHGLSLSPQSMEEIEPDRKVVLPSPNGSTLSLATGSVPTLAGCLRNASAVAEAALGLGGPISIIPAGERWESGGLRPCLEDWLGAGAVVDAMAAILGVHGGAAGGAPTEALSPVTDASADGAPAAAGNKSPDTTAARDKSPDTTAARGKSPDATTARAKSPHSAAAGDAGIWTLSPEVEAARDLFRGSRTRLSERLRGCVSGVELLGRDYVRDVELSVELDVSCIVPRLVDGAFRAV